MKPLPLLASLIALALPAGARAAPDLLPILGLSSTVQHVELDPRFGPYEVHAHALRQVVEVRPRSRPRRLARRLERRLSGATICHRASVEDGAVVLACRTPRLVVRARDGGIDIFALRGIPWEGEEDGPPAVALIEGACEQTAAFSRGECAFLAGDLEAAAAAYAEARGGAHRRLAELRLGDLAARRGDVRGAVQRWAAVMGFGRIGRLAAVRLAAVTGEGLDERALFDPVGLPEGYHRDLVARHARIDAFLGRVGEAVDHLASDPLARGACGPAGSLCLALLLRAFEDASIRPGPAFGLYLEVPHRFEGPLALRTAQAAARRAAAEGAPAFGASLLAAVTPLVKPAHLEAHLLETARLYRQGGDAVRAGFVVDYARSRLGPKVVRRRGWRRVVAPPAPPRAVVAAADPAPDPEAAEAVQDTLDLADAVLLHARSRQVEDAPAP